MLFMLQKKIMLVIILSVLSLTGFAQTESAQAVEKKKRWKGEAELGLVSTTGNTDTQSVNAKFFVENNREFWQHQLKLETLRSEDRDTVTADRREAFYRSLYKLSELDYLFGSFKYEDDRFSGFNKRTRGIFGYGRKVIVRERFKLNAEVGAGARQADRTDGRQSDEAIVRVGTNLKWDFAKTSSFKQEIFIERGDENTFSESKSELKVKINAALAMKLSLVIKNNSSVPAGNKKTDTLTAVTLVYDF